MNNYKFIQISNDKVRESWRKIVSLHIIYIIVGALGGVDYFKSKNLLFGLLINGIYQIVLSVIIWYILKDYLQEMWRNFKSIGIKRNIKKIAFGLFVTFFMCLGFRILVTSCSVKLSVAENQLIVNEYIKRYPIMLFAISVILGTFTEEVLYRGIIFQTFRNKGKIFACINTSFLFGLIHIISTVIKGTHGWETIVVLLINYMILGMAFAIIYEKNRNLWINYFVHAIWNAISSGMTIAMLFANR